MRGVEKEGRHTHLLAMYSVEYFPHHFSYHIATSYKLVFIRLKSNHGGAEGWIVAICTRMHAGREQNWGPSPNRSHSKAHVLGSCHPLIQYPLLAGYTTQWNQEEMDVGECVLFEVSKGTRSFSELECFSYNLSFILLSIVGGFGQWKEGREFVFKETGFCYLKCDP